MVEQDFDVCILQLAAVGLDMDDDGEGVGFKEVGLHELRDFSERDRREAPLAVALGFLLAVPHFELEVPHALLDDVVEGHQAVINGSLERGQCFQAFLGNGEIEDVLASEDNVLVQRLGHILRIVESNSTW